MLSRKKDIQLTVVGVFFLVDGVFVAKAITLAHPLAWLQLLIGVFAASGGISYLLGSQRPHFAEERVVESTAKAATGYMVFAIVVFVIGCFEFSWSAFSEALALWYSLAIAVGSVTLLPAVIVAHVRSLRNAA